MKTLAATLIVLIAAPAMAQDLNYSNGHSRDCVDAAGTLAAQIACIGRSANACMKDTPGGETTVGMAGCLDRELTHWDNRLNRIYGRLRDQERRTGLDDELLAMQRAWITYRDTRCAYEVAQWSGGTGAGPAHLFCMMQVTGEQALYLRSMER